MKKLFAEVLKEVAEVDDLDDKVIVLQNNDELRLRQLLLAAFDKRARFDVKIPSYRENKEVDGYATNTLYSEVRRLYIFMDTYSLPPAKKTSILTDILESIDPSDAVALIDVLNKDLTTKYGITKEVVDAAFPGLIKFS